MKNNKLNIIDLALVVTILLLAGVTVYRRLYIGAAKDTTLDMPVRITVEVPSLDAHLLEQMKTGDTVRLERSGTDCGTLTDISAVYVKDAVTYADGTVSEHTDPDHVSCVLTLGTNADHVPDGIRFGDAESIHVGETLSFYTNALTFDGFVAKIEQTA